MSSKLEENKFLVINHKYLDALPANVKEIFRMALCEVQKCIPENKYYVCNQDEPYAEDVLKVILSGEAIK